MFIISINSTKLYLDVNLSEVLANARTDTVNSYWVRSYLKNDFFTIFENLNWLCSEIKVLSTLHNNVHRKTYRHLSAKGKCTLSYSLRFRPLIGSCQYCMIFALNINPFCFVLSHCLWFISTDHLLFLYDPANKRKRWCMHHVKSD